MPAYDLYAVGGLEPNLFYMRVSAQVRSGRQGWFPTVVGLVCLRRQARPAADVAAVNRLLLAATVRACACVAINSELVSLGKAKAPPKPFSRRVCARSRSHSLIALLLVQIYTEIGDFTYLGHAVAAILAAGA